MKTIEEIKTELRKAIELSEAATSGEWETSR